MTDHFRLKKLDIFLADHFGADHFSDFFFFRFPVFRCRSFQRSFCWIFFFDWAAIILVNFFPHQDARSFSDDRFSKCCVSGTDSMFCYVMFPLATTTQFSHHGGFVKHSKQSRRRCLHATTNQHRLCALPSGTFKSPNCFPFRTRMDRRQDTKRLGHTTVMLARMRLCS